MPDHPSRRALLAAAAIAGVGACTGRSSPAAPSPVRPGPLEQAVLQARSDAAALRASALVLAGSWTAGRRLAERIAADHAAHLTALGAPAATASPSPGSSGSPVRPGGQLDAEWTAARAALAAGVDTSPGGPALLLVRIAAARAVHADLLAVALKKPARGELTPTPAVGPSAGVAASATANPTASPSATPSPGSALATPTEKALNRLLAGEHAAVYAYPVVIARTTGSRRRLARQEWVRHQQAREALEHRLLSAGVIPVESEPAYAISPVPASAGQAEGLAATLERRLAALDADVVATAVPGRAGSDRADAAGRLVDAARSAAAWSGRSDALPGTPGTPRPAVTPTP